MTSEEKPTLRSDDDDLLRLQRKAWSALDNLRPRTVFRRAADIVRVVVLKVGAIVQDVTWQRLGHELNRAAKWERVTRHGIEKSRAPKHLLEDMLAHPKPPMPELIRVAEVPLFTSTGELIATPGYHTRSGIFLVIPPDLRNHCDEFLSISEPTQDEVRFALERINDPLQNFPFVGQADRAHAIALFLLPFLRELIDGPTPLHLIHKPSPGTGGTLLAQVINLTATGSPLEVMTLTKWEEEHQRTITARLLRMPTYLLLDNVHELDSGVLAGAITSTIWIDRKMGSSDAPSIPVRCGWIATGNNPSLSPEIARRSVSIRLDAHMEHPEDRTGFRHPELRAFVKERRPDLIAAAITLVRAWQAAGAPHGTKTFGMFESWAKVIGGILDVAGVEGFLQNLDELRRKADAQTTNWKEFVTRWVGRFGTHSVGVAELWEILDDPEPLNLGIDRTKDLASQKTTLGQQLVCRRGRVIGAYRLIEVGERHRAKQWRLDLVHDQPSEPGEPSCDPPPDGFTAAKSSATYSLQTGG